MIKFLMLFSTIFFSAIKENDYKIYEDNFKSEEIVKSIDDYTLSIDKNTYILDNGKKSINIEVNSLNNEIDFFEIDEKIVLFVKEQDELNSYTYDKNLLFLETQQIIRRGVESFKCFPFKNKVIIYGTVNEDCDLTRENFSLKGLDTFICVYNLENYSTKFFGGETNEEFLLGTDDGDEMFFCGYKSPLGEGDFGNGGKYQKSVFITKINNNLKIEKTIVLDENDNIVSFYYYNYLFYLITKDKIYTIDSEMNIISKESFSEEILFTNMSSEGVLSICFLNKVIVKDLLNRKELEKELSGKVVGISDAIIIERDNKLIKLDLALLYKFKNKETYLEKESALYSLFGKCSIIEEKFSPLLDKQVYGEYKCYQYYKTKGGINIEYVSDYIVEKEVNVYSGGLYPVGYRLIFAGKGYLNGNKILNNYQITSSGDYTLELVGVDGDSYEIKFKVSNLQIEFVEESIRESNTEIYLGDKASIKLKVDFSDEVVLDSFVINEKNVNDIYYDKTSKLVYIQLDSFNDTGMHIYNIERAYYKIDDFLYSEEINKTYKINVLKDDVNVAVESFNKERIVFSCNDINLSCRYFEVVAKNNKDEIVYTFPLNSQNIIIDGLNQEDEYIVEVYLVTDNGSKNYTKIMLFKMNLMDVKNKINLGKISILKYQNYLEKFSFEYDSESLKDEIRRVTVNQKDIFENQTFSSEKYYLLLLITFSLAFGLTLFFKRTKNNKKCA